MNIFVDVDDVTLNLLDEWLRLYNIDHETFFTAKDIHGWNVQKYVLPNTDVYKYLKFPHLYDNVKAFPGALEAVRKIRDEIGHRVIFATASPVLPSLAYKKFERLNELGFSVDIQDYVELLDKSILLGEMLLDDKYENVVGFHGKGWLFTRTHNESFEYEHRISSWSEFLDVVEQASIV